jgi:hypothetical protein
MMGQGLGQALANRFHWPWLPFLVVAPVIFIAIGAFTGVTGWIGDSFFGGGSNPKGNSN